MVKLLTNWCPEHLNKLLTSRGIVVDKISSSSLGEVMSHGEGYEYIYFARFSPPIFDRSIFIYRKKLKNLVYAFHAPLEIDIPIRPSHHIYNMLMPKQAKLIYIKGAKIHVLNHDDHVLSNNMGIKRSFFVPLGIDTNQIRPKEKDSVFTILYASRASWHKGTDLLVSSIIPLLLRKLHEDAKIVVIKYGYMSDIYRRININSKISLLDFLPRSDFINLLTKSHILLFPSRYESYGRLLIESLSAKVIPVTFNVRGVARDVIKKDDLLRDFVVSQLDITGFIKKVLYIYHLWRGSNDFYQKLTQRARKIALRYSWDSIFPLFKKMFTVT